MKNFTYFAIILITFLQGCGNDDPMNLEPLSGQIDGATWEFRFGQALVSQNAGNDLIVSLFSTREQGNDPCAIVNTGLAHIEFTIPRQTGTLVLPFIDVNETLVFVPNGIGQNPLFATSGFIDISEVANNGIVGFLQATLDDENTVEGSFVAEICF